VQGVYEFNGGTFSDRASAWTIGAVFRWNLFGGFADSARLGEAESGHRARAADRERQETAARVDVRAAAARLEEARARAEVGRLAVAQAKESQRIVRDRFDAGLAPVNDLLRSSMAVLDADARQTLPQSMFSSAPRCSSGRVEGNAIMNATYVISAALIAAAAAGCSRGDAPKAPAGSPVTVSVASAAEQDLVTPFEAAAFSALSAWRSSSAASWLRCAPCMSRPATASAPDSPWSCWTGANSRPIGPGHRRARPS